MLKNKQEADTKSLGSGEGVENILGREGRESFRAKTFAQGSGVKAVEEKYPRQREERAWDFWGGNIPELINEQ